MGGYPRGLKQKSDPLHYVFRGWLYIGCRQTGRQAGQAGRQVGRQSMKQGGNVQHIFLFFFIFFIFCAFFLTRPGQSIAPCKLPSRWTFKLLVFDPSSVSAFFFAFFIPFSVGLVLWPLARDGRQQYRLRSTPRHPAQAPFGHAPVYTHTHVNISAHIQTA